MEWRHLISFNRWRGAQNYFRFISFRKIAKLYELSQANAVQKRQYFVETFQFERLW
jgi:hypothetical protein